MALKILYHSRFLKHFQERISPNKVLVEAYKNAIEFFTGDPSNPVLRDHELTGSMYGYRSFEAADDLLVIYFVVKDGIILYDIGSHDQVYSR